MTITAISNLGNVSTYALIDVRGKDVFDFDLQASIKGNDVSIRIENNGTIIDGFNLSTCRLERNIVLNPSESRTIAIGAINGTCPVCVTSKWGRRCISLSPIRIDFLSPREVATNAGSTINYEFIANATQSGVLIVRPSNRTWFDEFVCNATCIKTLSFVPQHMGTFPIEFEMYWAQQNLYQRERVTFIIGEPIIDIEGDKQQLGEMIDLLNTRMEGLKLKGITSPAAKKLINEVEESEPQNLQELAEAKGKLEQTQRYLDYAKTTRIEQQPFAWTQIIIGIFALLVAGLTIRIISRPPTVYHYTAGFDWRGTRIPVQLQKKEPPKEDEP